MRRPSKKPFAWGAKLERAIRVGESSSAAGTSWRISGSVLSANSLSRSKVNRDSSRKVGKARKSASMSRSRAAVVRKTALELRIRLGELTLAAAQRPEGDGAVAEELPHREPLGVEDAEEAVELGEGGFELGESVGEALPAALDRDRRLPLPFLEGGAGGGVEGAEDLVQLDRFGDVAVGSVAAVGQLRPVGVARGQLDVGLAEQRLGAQDRPRAARDRPVLGRRCRSSPAPVRRRAQIDRLHFADRDAGDPHVGLLGELGRLAGRGP